MFKDLRPEWKCLDCGHTWKRLTVPDKCPKCGSEKVMPWLYWGLKNDR
ncbi:rubredoxin-like domain-containing protein [Thermococcus sp.]